MSRVPSGTRKFRPKYRFGYHIIWTIIWWTYQIIYFMVHIQWSIWYDHIMQTTSYGPKLWFIFIVYSKGHISMIIYVPSDMDHNWWFIRCWFDASIDHGFKFTKIKLYLQREAFLCLQKFIAPLYVRSFVS